MCMGSKGCHGISINGKVPRNDILETIFRESQEMADEKQDSKR